MPVKKTKNRGKTKSKTHEEAFRVKGEELVGKVKKLVKEGNIRKITIKDKNGKILIVIPLTIGVMGVILAPTLAAVGAIATLVTECTISIERTK